MPDHAGRFKCCKVNLAVHELKLMESDLRYPRTNKRTKSTLRESALNRHLATLKSHLVEAAGAGLLTLHTSACRLTQPGTGSTPNALGIRTGPFSGL
jgi:type II secretory ATPase GspE/PulE/Tfp pilus assembly ATPase PilB-like protein